MSLIGEGWQDVHCMKAGEADTMRWVRKVLKDGWTSMNCVILGRSVLGYDSLSGLRGSTYARRIGIVGVFEIQIESRHVL